MKYKIVADSSCDFLTLKDVNFEAVPLKISTNDKNYVDDAKLNLSEMLKELKEYKGRSYTACPNIQEWLNAYDEADNIFVVTITSALSGSYSAAIAAKKMMESTHPNKKIHVFDTLSAGPGVALIVEKLQELILNNETFDEICEKVTQYQKDTQLIFALKSIHNFVQNGRVNKVVGLAVGTLNIRMIGAASEEGTLEIIGKQKGEKKSIEALFKEMEKRGYKGGKVNIGHCENEQGAATLKDLILSKYKNANISLYHMRGLCCYYAEPGGMLMGFETL